MVDDNQEEPTSVNVAEESLDKETLVKRISNEQVYLKKLVRERSVDLVDAQFEGFGSKRFCICLGQSYEEMKEENIQVYNMYPEEMIDLCVVAIRREDSKVLGYLQMYFEGMLEKLNWSAFGCWGLLEEQLYYRCDPDEAYVSELAVIQEARGKGIGTMLLNWAHEHAKHCGKNVITIQPVQGNPAKRLYERLGYEVVERQQGCCKSFIENVFVFCGLEKMGLTHMQKRL